MAEKNEPQGPVEESTSNVKADMPSPSREEGTSNFEEDMPGPSREGGTSNFEEDMPGSSGEGELGSPLPPKRRKLSTEEHHQFVKPLRPISLPSRRGTTNLLPVEIPVLNPEQAAATDFDAFRPVDARESVSSLSSTNATAGSFESSDTASDLED